MQQKTAYGLLTLKSFDEKTRSFKGIASTVSPDRSQDIVEPKGAEFRLPIPFLHQHSSDKPIGQITKARVTKDGIEVDGFVENMPDAPASLKERLDVAWAEIKSGLVRGLSIGFSPKEYSFIKETGGIHFTKWEWLELSAVTIPANAEASITAIKSIDQRIRMSAFGRESGVPSSAGATASRPSNKGTNMKTLQEQVAELRATAETKRARLKEIDDVVTKDGLNDESREEISTLTVELKDVDAMISMKEGQIERASTATTVETKSGSRGPSFIVKSQDPDDKFVGQSYTRMIIAKAAAHMARKEGITVSPSEIASRRWGQSHKKLVAFMKANEVAGGGSGSGEWGAELVQVDARYTGDFIDYLYSKTVFDRLPLRAVPARARIKGQDGASTGFWVGESKAIKVTTADFSATDTTPYKVGSIAVFSKELMEDSDPSVEMLVRDSLEEALRQRVDTTFLSASAASAGVSPAGLLNGLSAVAASNGPDAQSARTDYRALIAPFITAKNVGGLYWVTNPTLAVGLGSMVNALGQPEFSGLTVEGGMYMGYPMITGDNVGSGDFLLVKPSDIWKIGDRGVQVSISDTAMIEQSSAPTGESDTPVAASATLVSMFQEDSVAIKVTRRISYGKRRSSAVQWIDDAAYGAEAS